MLEVIVDLGYKPKIAPSRVETETDTTIDGSTWAMPQLLVSALLEAEETRKLVLVYFFAEWCGACKTMEKTTFQDPMVIGALKRFVFVKVDTDLHPATAKHFNVVGMPTLLVLDDSGEQLYRYVGPIEADKLSQALLSLPGAGRAIENN